MSNVVSPSQLYLIDEYDVDFNISSFWGCYYSHIPELSDYFSHYLDLELITKDQRIERRILKHVDYDGRRYWELVSVWFDKKPVMITKNAGREGDDHSGRYVTDLDVYFKMVNYIFNRINPYNTYTLAIDPNELRNDILCFYGDSYNIPK